MRLSIHPDLPRLISLLLDLGEDCREAIGLLPMSELRHSGYSAAPQNSLAFAGTGGDGVHFSFLAFNDTEPALWPVVMTVPMNFDQPNLVVGSNLQDFLGLGIRHGYFELEQLAYNRSSAVTMLGQDVEPTQISSSKSFALASIKRTFEVDPWENHEQKLADLQAAFRLPRTAPD